jgi:putative SOS response-associated peptidase YedK
MCGRITQNLTSDEIAELFGAQDEIQSPGGRFNVAPTQNIVGVAERDERRVVTTYRWGLIPPWAESAKIGVKMINARAETVAEKPAFRSALRKTRCIIPTDAFYEWQRGGAAKVPHAVVRQDGRPLALAGLWTSWRDPATEDKIRSCTIITTAANETLSPIHERMPVILPDEVWDEWLDPGNSDVPALQSLLVPSPNDWVRAYRVSTQVNNVRNDSPELLVPT